MIQATDISEGTLRQYESALRCALNGQSLNLDVISEWGASRRTILRAALRKTGLPDLCKSVPRTRRKRVDLKVPMEEELEDVEKSIQLLPDGERQCVALLLRLGLRSSEMLTLTRASVLRAVRTGKLDVLRKGNYESRMEASFAVDLLRELLACEARYGGPWKVVGEILSGGCHKTRYERLRRVVGRAGRRAHVQLRPHLLRHCFATQMALNGAPPHVIAKALGQTDVNTTWRYLHAAGSDVLKYVHQPSSHTTG